MIFKFNDNFSNLPKIISEYDDILDKAKDNLNLMDKRLELANREQPSWYCYYNQKLQEVKSLQSLVDAKIQYKKGSLWKHYMENSNIQLKTTDLEQWISADKTMVEYRNYSIIVDEMVGMFSALVKAFETRGYALRNITDARVHEVENSVLI